MIAKIKAIITKLRDVEDDLMDILLDASATAFVDMQRPDGDILGKDIYADDNDDYESDDSDGSITDQEMLRLIGEIMEKTAPSKMVGANTVQSTDKLLQSPRQTTRIVRAIRPQHIAEATMIETEIPILDDEREEPEESTPSVGDLLVALGSEVRQTYLSKAAEQLSASEKMDRDDRVSDLEKELAAALHTIYSPFNEPGRPVSVQRRISEEELKAMSEKAARLKIIAENTTIPMPHFPMVNRTFGAG